MDETRVEMTEHGPGLYGSDRELFRRVWSRVAPEGSQSPIRLEPPPIPRQEQDEEVPMERGLVPLRPREEAQVDCLGEGAMADVPRLEEMARHALEDARVYQALGRRAGGAAARALAGMAADARRQAKRLAAAYFLITGRRWQGTPVDAERMEQDMMQTLRRQYMAQQRGAVSAQTAAQETSDPCLRQLYEELAREKQTHARMIRGLLEQM